MQKFFEKIMNIPIVKAFMTYYKSAEMDLSSIAVAYYFLLSMFPILMTFANALPYLKIDSTSVLKMLNDLLPGQLYDVVEVVIKSFLDTPSPGLLWVGIISGFWTFSKGLSALQKAMNKAYKVDKHRDFIVSQLIGFASSFAIIILITLAIIVLTFGQTILTALYNNIHFDRRIYEMLYNMTLPVVAIVVFTALILLYFLLPNVKIKKIRYVLPGAIFSTFVLVFLTKIFGDYVNRYVNKMMDFKMVGSLLTFALMLWFIFIAKVLITGAIMNASVQSLYVDSFETRRGEIVSIIKSLTQNENPTYSNPDQG
ncbi:ribonuclease BN [Floricoccus penangensis]|uniref:Ribonuclease BN n=2 Tax=Floricoccus penangensis TaxID=1859475 RepID=A0A9Q5JGW8_9LACT|nr:ribonuclease BN [Floricoccus penangensis]